MPAGQGNEHLPHLTGIAARLSSAVASQYRIERELGAGGMATVFLAHDLKHDRDVAMKVLHPDLSAALGTERFLAEIKTTARLQHPHILPLLDSGESQGLLYFVMPVVAGESLRTRLVRERQLPIDDALRIGRDVAAALDYAHRHGIIHRDIKPENILLHEGQALVADFGIALALSAAGGERMTLTGISLGTPHYMSPEQAMGDRRIDARSDVYSLAAVTFEMLAGEPPFTAATPQAVLAKVITDRAPSLTVSRDLVPPHVAAAVDKALGKLPADRFGSALEFTNALSDPRFGAPDVGRVASASSARLWRAIATTTTLAAAGLGAMLWTTSPRSAATPSVYDVALPDSAPIRFANSRNLSVSPAGDFVIYAASPNDSASPRLWYRSLLDDAARPLPGTEGAFDPSISPDGQFVAFFTLPYFKIVPVAGGVPRTLGTVRDPVAIRWLSPARLFVMEDDAKTVRWFDPQVGESSAEPVVHCISPQWLAREESLLCGGGGQKFATVTRPGVSTVRLLRPVTGTGANDWITGSQFRIIDDQYLVYTSVEGELRAARIDRRRWQVGRPVTLVSGIRREAYRGEGQYDIAPNGTLLYALGDNAEIGYLVRTRSNGTSERLPFEPAAFLRYDMSPDGRRIAAIVQGSGAHELRIYDVRDGRYRTWMQNREIGHAIWSPRGDRLATAVGHDSINTAVIIGSPGSAAPPETLAIGRTMSPMSWRSDSLIIGTSFTTRHMWSLDLGQRPARLDTLMTDVGFPDLSPDGRLLVFMRASTSEAIITPFPARDRLIHVTTRAEAHWVTSTRLRYRAVGGWYEVDVDLARTDVVGRPRLVHVDPRFSDTPGWSQRTTPDGGMIYVQGLARTSASYLRVVPNWVAQMKRAVDQADR
jgi:serine/threonine protein kinase